MTQNRLPPWAPPRGLRDELPVAARRREQQLRLVHGELARRGYVPIELPSFEGASGAEYGIAFVDPEEGVWSQFHPDPTRQAARLISNRLRDEPLPIRIRYSARPIASRKERGRVEREGQQVGAEMIGPTGIDADVELLRTAVEITSRLKINECLVELSLPELSRRVLDAALSDSEASLQLDMREALRRKEFAYVDRVAQKLSVKNRRLIALLKVQGPAAETLDSIREVDRSYAPALAQLRSTAVRLRDRSPECQLHIDLGEMRGNDYYTGLAFGILSPGLGEPLIKGGRYDNLLGHYGWHVPAIGFAFDLSALDRIEHTLPNEGPPVWVTSSETFASKLIAQGVGAVLVSETLDLQSYQRHWGYFGTVSGSGKKWFLGCRDSTEVARTEDQAVARAVHLSYPTIVSP